MAKVLIGYSACPLTRAAFEAQGHDAWTCDLLPARDGALNHLQCDVWEVLNRKWDFAFLHPMCTFLNNASVWALKDPDLKRYPNKGGYHQRLKPGTLFGAERRAAKARDVENFKRLLDLDFPVAIENPAPSGINTAIRPPDQVIHPFHFGDDASKGTGLWLTKGAPKLQLPDLAMWAVGRLVEWPQGSGQMVRRYANQTDSGQSNVTPSSSRWLDRSETYPGIAYAAGTQWGKWLKELNHG